MIYIDDDLRRLIDNALDDRCPMSIGTVSGEGEPQISMKGSVLVLTGKRWPTGNGPGVPRRPI